MRSVVLTCLITGVVVALGACGSLSIDDSLETDDTTLPDRSPAAKPDGGTIEKDSGPVKPETVTLTVTLTGTGAVTSTPTGVTCSGTTCTGTFPKGTAVTLAAAPASGSIFGGWSGACTGMAACASTADKDLAVTADFPSLTGTWAGTYTNNRVAFGCTFNNAGNLGLTVTASGATFTDTANVTGLQLKNGNCDLVGMTTGAAPSSPVTIANDTLTGTWNMNVQSGGNLAFPFTAKVAGKTMTGSWTCAGCTGTFTLTKP
ncbi:hypothetical protein BH11MYX4_BH11MYX4_48550 [soil metagenome]